MFSQKEELVCVRCGGIGEPEKIGLELFSGLVAIVGAIATMVGLAIFVVPGLIFGILTAAHIAHYRNKNGVECRHCLSRNSMVPIDTPMGLSVIEKFERVAEHQACL